MRLVSASTIRLGDNGSIIAQLVDSLGTDTAIAGSKLKSVELYFNSGESVDVTNVSQLTTTGQLTIQTSAETPLVKGSFHVDMALEVGKNGNTKRLSSTDTVKVLTTIKMKSIAYEVTDRKDANKDGMNDAKVWEYPSKIASFDQEKGTDEKFLHFYADVSLFDAKGTTVGKPDQVYLALKKVDFQADEQLQINA